MASNLGGHAIVKRCPMCCEHKPLDEFGKQFKRGRVMPRTYCKPCMTVYERDRMRKYRAEVDSDVALMNRTLTEREVCAAFAGWRGPVSGGLMGARL